MKRIIKFVYPLFCMLVLFGCNNAFNVEKDKKKNKETEPLFEYTLELNIINESSTERTVMTEAYVLYDDINHAYKLYDCEPMTIPAEGNLIYTTRIQDSLCAAPHLSHIIRIGDVAFAGFDTGAFKKQTDDLTSLEEFSVTETVLGSVDWTKDNAPILKIGDKSFCINEDLSELKMTYTVTIKDDIDILETEREMYTHGIKITPQIPST